MMAGNTPQFLKDREQKIQERIKKRIEMDRYVSHLRTQSDTSALRRQPQKNLKKKWVAKQLHWL